MTKVYMRADLKDVAAGTQLNRILAKAFEHKSVKLVRIEHTDASYADVSIFKGNAWISKRVFLT